MVSSTRPEDELQGAERQREPGPLPRRFFRSAASNYANSVVLLLIAFFVTPILVHGLGKDAYGIWTLVSASVVYFGILQFGFAGACVKFVASGIASGDRMAVKRTISTAFVVLSVPAVALLAVAPGLAYLFPRVFDVPPGLKEAAMVVVILSTVDFAASIPCDTFGAALVGLQRFDLLSVTLTATALAQATSWVVILALGGGLVAIGAATLTFSLASHVARYLIVRRQSGEPVVTFRAFDRNLIKPLATMSSWMAVGDILELVTLRLDPLVVAFVAGVPAVGIYALGQKLSGFVESFLAPVLSSFYPHASELSASGGADDFRRTLFAGSRLALCLAIPLTLTVSVLAAPALHAWVGPGFEEAAPVVVFLSLTSLVVAVPRVGMYMLQGKGDVSFAARVGIVEATINVVLSILLGRRMGIQGVALGTLIGVLFNHLLVLLPYMCRKLGVSVWSFVFNILKAHALPTLVALLVGFELRSFAFEGIVPLLLSGGAMLLAYLAPVSVTGISSSERHRIRLFIASKRSPGVATR
jgi:O-antigen/teichoic acid export membrane protein